MERPAKGSGIDQSVPDGTNLQSNGERAEYNIRAASVSKNPKEWSRSDRLNLARLFKAGSESAKRGVAERDGSKIHVDRFPGVQTPG